MIFVIGFRRSGTTFLSNVIRRAGIKLEFEPHEWWFSACISRMSRYRHNKWVNGILQEKQNSKGAKFALNPGVESVRFKAFLEVYPKARYVFIKRNHSDTFWSYWREDSIVISNEDYNVLGGAVHAPQHAYFWNLFYYDVGTLCRNNENMVLVDYDDIIVNRDGALQNMWHTIGVEQPPSIRDMVRKPSHWSLKVPIPD